MARRSFRLGVMLLACLWRAEPALAQDPIDRLLGRTVTAVHLDVEGEPASPVPTSLAQRLVGAPLRVDQLRGTVAELYRAGRYDEISVVGHQTSGGVELFYHLTPPHEIDRVEFVLEDDPGMSADTLRQRLLAQLGGMPTRGHETAAAATVAGVLKDEGFLAPIVTSTVALRHAPHRGTMIFTVTAGARAVVRSVAVAGASPLDAKTVLDRTGVAVGGPFRPAAIGTALDAIVEDLRKRGYYEAAAHVDPPAASAPQVDVILTVDAGSAFDLIARGDPLPAGKTINDFVPIRQEHSADVDLLEDSERRIESALRSDGFWRAKASFQKEVTPQRTLIAFTIARGPRYLLNSVTVTGDSPGMRSAIDPLLLLKLQAPFDEAALDAAAGRVRAMYRSLGYSSVTVDSSAKAVPGSETATTGLVDATITISEGPRVTVANIVVNQLDTGAKLPDAALMNVLESRRNEPFRLENVQKDLDALVATCRNDGYLAPTVEPKQMPSADGTQMTLTYDLTKGPLTLVGNILVTGNHDTKESTILSAVTLRPDTPLSAEQLEDTARRVRDLQLFRSVTVTPAPRGGADNHADIIIAVDEAPATTVAFGGGVQGGRRPITSGGVVQDRIEFAPRGTFEVTRRNLFGKNRTANLFSSLALRRRNDGTGGYGFTQYDVDGTFDERSIFQWNADAQAGVTFEQGSQSEFNFLRRGVHADLVSRRWSRVTLAGRYALDNTKLFDQNILPAAQLLIDRVFPQVRLSTFSSSIARDTRNDPATPASGTYLDVTGAVAARAVGSEVGFVKTTVEMLAFHALNPSGRLILAGAARVGLARGFARTVPVLDANGQAVLLPDGQAETQEFAQVPASQRFFAGGADTVRGFQTDSLGVPSLLNSDGLSNGGNGLLVFNAELRAAVWRAFGVVGFMDAGNVFPTVSQIALASVRTTAGFGVRIKSPVGPMRLDFGFKLGGLLATDHGRAEFHFGLGEAF